MFFQGSFVGILAEQFGERRLAMIGSAIAAVGLASSSLATEVRCTEDTHFLLSDNNI